MASEDQSVARSTGTVSWFNNSKGYGFITPDEGGEELFVHQSSILSDGFRSLFPGDSIEFSITEGSDGKTKAVDVTAPGGAPFNKIVNSSRGYGGARRGGGCFKCGEAGHIAKDCRDERGTGGEGCYSCGEVGHIAKDCVNKSGGSGDRRAAAGAGREGCYNCGDVGHFARDCVQKSSENVRSGGGERSGGACYTCGGFGHMARDCATKRQSGACYECGGTGHLARDCDRRGSGGGRGDRGKCFNCGEEGHFARDCTSVA